MKQLLVIFLVGFLSVKALGQQSVDLGFFGGAGTYFGDMTKIDFQKSVNPAYGGFLRFNFNPRYALRFNVLNGTIGATGEFDSQKWKWAEAPDYKYWNFNKNVLDLALYFEWNYMKYIVGEKETPWSTFIYGGVGVQMYSFDLTYRPQDPISGSEIAPTLPFGLGVKYNLSKKWGIGIEGTLRKTFSDKLDNLDDPLSYMSSGNVQVTYTDQLHNNDWTAYLGVHLVYKIISENRNWELRTVKEHNMIDWGIFNKSRR